jgi:hypothetical protein
MSEGKPVKIQRINRKLLRKRKRVAPKIRSQKSLLETSVNNVFRSDLTTSSPFTRIKAVSSVKRTSTTQPNIESLQATQDINEVVIMFITNS